ncbi:MAG: UvrB/UvrC motif-containing protein [Sphingomonadaceae bacterium]|nr:UvrB/UvrC motif-containing protein [Sphingomonadaceae bacterium]
MTDGIDDLRRRMEAAAAALDFEEAKRLRDQISLLRGGASPDAVAAADTRGLSRQAPGAMGLGTSQQRVTPPAGWTPPRKPDPMTTGASRPRGRGGQAKS